MANKAYGDNEHLWIGKALHGMREGAVKKIGYQKIELLYFLVDNKDKLPKSTDKISLLSGISYATVSTAVKTLREKGLIYKGTEDFNYQLNIDGKK